VIEDRGVECADIGKVPIEAAARHPHGFGQRLCLQGSKAVCCQYLKALIEPVFCRELIGHTGIQKTSPYTSVLTVAKGFP
jgi:hypothetical protein